MNSLLLSSDICVRIGGFAGVVAVGDLKSTCSDVVRIYLAWTRIVVHNYPANGKCLPRAEAAVHIFDPALMSWRSVEHAWSWDRCEDASAIVTSGSLFFCGGSVGINGPKHASVANLDCNAKVWNDAPLMLQPRSGHAVARLGKHLYVFGGSDRARRRLGFSRMELNSVERFCLVRRVWEEVAPMLESRSDAVATAISDFAYICGGYSCSSCELKSVERYDPSVDIWEALSPMTQARVHANCCSIGGQLFLHSDEVFNPNPDDSDDDASEPAHLLSSVEVYCPLMDVWRLLPSMREERVEASFVALSGCLYVCGGIHGSGRVRGRTLRSVERFKPERGSWEILPQMPEARAVAAAIGVSGKIYVFGGYGAFNANEEFYWHSSGFTPGEQLNSCLTFDLLSSAWEQVPSMPRLCGTLFVGATLIQ